jgi:hypothetical protein
VGGNIRRIMDFENAQVVFVLVNAVEFFNNEPVAREE